MARQARTRQSRGRRRRQGGANEQVILVDDLTGGLELNTAQSNLQPDQARRLSNFSLTEPGLLLTIPGYKDFSTTSLGGSRPQGGERIYTTTAAFTLVAYAGSIYKPSDAGVWGSAVLTGLSATNQIYFPYDRIATYVLDGTNVPQMSKNGTTWYSTGIAAPTVAPTTALVAGGSLIDTNSYDIEYTYATTSGFDSDLVHEGNGSAKVTRVAATPNLTIRVTVTGTTDPKVDKINIYLKNTTSGQTVFRRIGQIANPGSATTTTFDITTDVAETALEIPTNHDLPLAFSFATPWKNRMWARHPTIKNRIHFTQIFEPQTWPTNFYIDVPLDKGDNCESLVHIGDINSVFGLSGIYNIIGQTSLDFEVRPALTAETGAFGFRAAKRVESGIIHAGPPGVYLFDGASDRFLSLDIEKGWKDMVTNAAVADLQKIPIVYYQPLKQVAIAVPRLYPTGTYGEFVLDLNRTRVKQRETWSTTSRDIGGYISWDGNETSQGNVGRLFSWSPTAGKLTEERSGTSANGADLVADYEGPTFTTQLFQAIAVHGYVEYQPNAGTLALEFFVDGKSQGVQSFSLGSGLALYHHSTYHGSRYGGASRLTKPLVWPLAADGRNFTFHMTFTGKTQWRLFGYGFTLVSEPALSGI